MARIALTALTAVTALFALLATCSLVQADGTGRQSFVVHVGPKVTFEPPAMIEQTEQTAATPETAIRVSSTGVAGMTVQFEANRPLQVRLAPHAARSWTVTVDQNGNAQASSRGQGSATLLLSSDSELDELEIIATIISKD